MKTNLNPRSVLEIVVDTREQRPFAFSGPGYLATVARGGLKTGDYSLVGLEDSIAIERKSLDDLVGCLTVGRDRFERELDRSRSLACFAVVVEASMEDIARHRCTSRMSPHAALQSILAFQVRYGVPFIWAGSRSGAEYVAFWWLHKARCEHEARQVEAQAVGELEAMGRRRGRAKGNRTQKPTEL